MSETMNGDEDEHEAWERWMLDQELRTRLAAQPQAHPINDGEKTIRRAGRRICHNPR